MKYIWTIKITANINTLFHSNSWGSFSRFRAYPLGSCPNLG
jgi:hypothetical protein